MRLKLILRLPRVACLSSLSHQWLLQQLTSSDFILIVLFRNLFLFHSSPARTRMHPMFMMTILLVHPMFVMTILVILAPRQPSPARRLEADALLSNLGRRNGLKQG